MRNRIILFALIILPYVSFGQVEELTMLGNWQDNTIVPTVWYDNPYNEVWGLAVNGSEIAIIGSTEGTHFIDVTDPTNPTEIESAFIAGKAQGVNLVHRDFHDLNGFLYAVADEGASSLQVIDTRQLPDTAFLVYDSNEILQRAHNIFIDSTSQRMYACGVRTNTGTSVPLQIISITDPLEPQLLSEVSFFGSVPLPGVHDVFVKKDTAYINVGNNGFYVADLTNPKEPTLLGTMTDYVQQGYNHAGWVSTDGDHYFLADETHGTDIKTVDISDLEDIRVTNTFNAESLAATSIPHNLLVKCDRLYASYYYDGIQVFDVSDIDNPTRIAYYDTYPDADENGYAGSWGVYPYLPSGNILVSDMQYGLFVFSDLPGFTPCGEITTSVNSPSEFVEIEIFPNPTDDFIYIKNSSNNPVEFQQIELFSITGKSLQSWDASRTEPLNKVQLPSHIGSGIYLLKVSTELNQYSFKINVSK